MRPLLRRRLLWTLRLLLVMAAAHSAGAQPSCPPPLVQVVLHQQEVSRAGAAFTPHISLRVRSAPACSTPESYQFREAEVTLLRGRRPVSVTKLVHTAEVDLMDFAPVAQPGDRIYVFVLYENLYVVGATGERQPYRRPTFSPPSGMTATLLKEEARGIGFTWLLTQ